MPTAFITGINGQDGSYLADLLLSKGYRVCGMVRRASNESYQRIEHIRDRIELYQGDLLDQTSIASILNRAQPDEVYNLAAMSFVPTSWEQPVLTAEFTAVGVTRMLDALRHTCPGARFYQASSSEMFGKVRETPQRETTPFYPRSPYGVAKVYGHYITVNYRESYGIFACSGILFNHECITAETPVIIRKDGLLDCLPIAELIPDPKHVPQRELDFEIWDRGQWTRARLGTATWNEAGRASDKRVQRMLARCGTLCTTADHVLIRADGTDVRAEDVRAGERLLGAPLPEPPAVTVVSAELARFLGLMAAEGCVSCCEGKYQASFRNTDRQLLGEVASLWKRLFGGNVGESSARSGFTGQPIGGLNLNGWWGARHWLYEMLYTADGAKRVPRLVLNADARTWHAFLSGYNAGDGLKAGHGDREFKNFKTSSAVLAAGLWWMASRILDQKLTLNIDHVERDSGDYFYYSINLGVESGPTQGRHLLRPEDEVKRIREESYTGWLYDIETESGTFHAGVGNLVIHNSPRRGKEFVTRKISHAVAQIKLGLASELRLGNLQAKRDWGYAGDYVRAMYLMLQQEEPDDYVIGTGRTHTVQEFVEIAFDHAGLDWRRHVIVDTQYYRPAEVDLLLADSSKARQRLGWEPEVSFEELVRLMVDADIALLGGEQQARPAKTKGFRAA